MFQTPCTLDAVFCLSFSSNSIMCVSLLSKFCPLKHTSLGYSAFSLHHYLSFLVISRAASPFFFFFRVQQTILAVTILLYFSNKNLGAVEVSMYMRIFSLDGSCSVKSTADGRQWLAMLTRIPSYKLEVLRMEFWNFKLQARCFSGWRTNHR